MTTETTMPPATPAEAKSGGGVVLQRLVGRHSTATLILGDSEKMEIPAADGVITDPPYGMTDHAWDVEPPWETLMPLWLQVGVVVMTMQKPKTWKLAARWNPRHHWTWHKSKSASPNLARHSPLRVTEDVLVFGGKVWNPQMTEANPRHIRKSRKSVSNKTGQEYLRNNGDLMRNPVDLLNIPANTGDCHQRHLKHPTQKPVGLMEYLVLTYTNPGDTILDPYMGSGTTGIACLRTGRNFIGIERDAAHYKTACDRIAHELDGALL